METDIIALGGFLTTWVSIAGIYYKLGRLEESVKNLKDQSK